MGPAETLCDNDAQLLPRRGAILGVAVATAVVVYLPLYLSVIFGGFRIASVLVTCGLMASIPFVLARAVPRAASFDTPWLPRAWSHWLWFVGMVLILFVCKVITAMLVYPLGIRYHPALEIPTAASVILTGITVILIGPIAEEIFWRGYFLGQLRKLTPSAVALLTHSLLFGVVHLHLSQGCFASIQAFLVGSVLGTWRIRFRSLLPLMLAHMIFNGASVIPVLRGQYQVAELVESLGDDVAEDLRESFKNLRFNPKCREIEALIREPAQEAVPAIIDYFGDPDEDVRSYATIVLVHCFRREAEPYLREPLSSGDKNIVSDALFVVGTCRYSVYEQQVRDLAWSAADVTTQYLAVSTLWDLKDEEGLRGIAKSHPQSRVRESAERWLARP